MISPSDIRNEYAYLGVDCGVSGAVALLSESYLDIMDWSTPDEIIDQVAEWNADYNILICCVEKQWSHPGMNSKAMTSLLENYGIWQGIMRTLLIPMDLVAAITWQKKMNINGTNDSKAASLDKSRGLFPKYGHFFKRKGDHNRSDAALIARYAQLTMN